MEVIRQPPTSPCAINHVSPALLLLRPREVLLVKAVVIHFFSNLFSCTSNPLATRGLLVAQLASLTKTTGCLSS